MLSGRSFRSTCRISLKRYELKRIDQVQITILTPYLTNHARFVKKKEKKIVDLIYAINDKSALL